MKLGELTASLIRVSEKAANIARAIRSEHTLFELLVQEKTGAQKNERFVQDFKTLADVLVQETVKYDLEKQFHGIIGNIFGEESNQFTNACGETVTVEIKDETEKTAELLVHVLDGNGKASDLLAKLVHHDLEMATPVELDRSDIDVSTDEIGIWIDPIDSTAQYILGSEGRRSAQGVYEDGLPCVVVLIGAYLTSTGQPVAGVINQPFTTHDPQQDKWRGRVEWGMSHNGVNITSVNSRPSAAYQQAMHKPSIVMSTSEGAELKDALQKDFEICYAAGAGYKIFSVIDGLVDAYVLSQGSTYKWDTCGPQAILKCMGGSLVDFKKACDSVRPCEYGGVDACEVTYHQPDNADATEGQRWSNSGGIIAFRDVSLLYKITTLLQK